MAKKIEDDYIDDDEDELEGEDVEFDPDEESDIEDTEDGGAILKLRNEKDEKEQSAHFANIIDEVDQSDLSDMIEDLLEKIDRDKEAREKRDKQYEEGLRRTGLGDDAPGGAQFSGANKVVHPMLVEACVDFSARVMKEIFPSNGPVKTKILGEQEKEKLAKAQRKADFMNWQLTEQMPEFRGELEQLSTQLPLGGGQYLKLMWNNQYKRPQAEFIAIEDVYLPFAATNFYSAERKTHVQYITKMEYARRVKAGMYIDVDLGYASDPEFSKSAQANNKIEGKKESSYNEDGLRTIFEVYTFLDFGDGMEPYILSIDKTTSEGVSLYRNWEPEDENRKELDWIIEFPFVPWRGAYPISLTQMIGGLSGAATGALRALLDSAHIQNVPTLLKLKGGPNGQTINVQPTEVVELDGGAMVDDVRKIAMPLPFNGPSPVLFSLLGFLVEAGKGVIQTSFEKLSDQNPNQPVGTTMALIEQGMVVFSSIHARLHNSMDRVLKVLHRINSAYLTVEDLKAYEAGLEIDPSDFDGPMDIIPVSDPAIFSETQRFAQNQAILQRSQLFPQMYNQRKVEEAFLTVMKLSADDYLQPEPGKEDLDPISENVAASMGRPVYVLPKQDHLGHLMTHMAFLQSNLFGRNPAIITNYLYPMSIHLRDHLLNYYLTESHKAASKAEKDDVIGNDVSEQVSLMMKVQQFIEQQLDGFGQELATITQEAQQYKPQPQLPPDNTMQVAQLNAQTQQAAMQQRAQSDQAKLQIEQAKLQQSQQTDQARMQQSQELEKAKLQLAAQENMMAMQRDAQREMADAKQVAFKAQVENQRSASEMQARERMNAADNETAMRLAQAEIISGEKFGVSTGTGINPNP